MQALFALLVWFFWLFFGCGVVGFFFMYQYGARQYRALKS